nr:MAG TPA: hypothetical protein [Caudoviricetes sp.]
MIPHRVWRRIVSIRHCILLYRRFWPLLYH